MMASLLGRQERMKTECIAVGRQGRIRTCIVIVESGQLEVPSTLKVKLH